MSQQTTAPPIHDPPERRPADWWSGRSTYAQVLGQFWAEQNAQERQDRRRRSQLARQAQHPPRKTPRGRPVKLVGSTIPAFASIKHAADALGLRAGTIRQSLHQCGGTMRDGFSFAFAVPEKEALF